MVILLTSNGKIIGTWAHGIQPNTFLAIMSLVANLLLTLAFAQGLTISYWKRKLRGSTIAGLHHHWNAGQSIWGALKGLFNAQGIVNGLALLTVITSTVRSPLLQTAAGVVNDVSFPRDGRLDLHIAQKLPEGYTGYSQYARTGARVTAALTKNFSEVMQQYNTRAPIYLNHTDCGDMCEMTVKAFGFCASCITSSPPLPSLVNMTSPKFYDLFATGIDILPDAGPIYDYYNASLILNAVYVPTVGSRTYANKTCILKPSIMSYRIKLSNASVVTLESRWQDNLCYTNLTYQGPTSSSAGWATTLGGIQYAASNLFKSSASVSFGGSVSSVTFTGNLVSQHLTTDPRGAGAGTGDNLAWSDPVDDMINAISEISFRTSLYAAADQSLSSTRQNSTYMMVDQTVPYTGSSTHTIYRTNIALMITGVAFSLLGIIGLVPLYIGWWELGREVSMSPLEIAKAFDAPLLRDVQGNAEQQEIVSRTTGFKVRYGEVMRDGEGVLMLGNESDVGRLRKGGVYG